MSTYSYIFYFLSFIAIFCALMVVFSKNPVHSVLYLVATFFAIAGHYLLLNAQFLAAVHIIVYAGAIMVLFLYVIMMLNLNKDTEKHKSLISKGVAVVSGGLFMLTLIAAFSKTTMHENIVKGDPSSIGLVQNLGKALFNDYILPFEVSAILFLSAMVGAVYLGKRELN